MCVLVDDGASVSTDSKSESPPKDSVVQDRLELVVVDSESMERPECPRNKFAVAFLTSKTGNGEDIDSENSNSVSLPEV
jgi:hypothetical protein